MSTVVDQVRACALVPVIKLNDPAAAVMLARALLAGGVNVVEITFRTATAAQSISAIAREVPEMLVGAGTVLTVEQLEAARAAGARFIVSPGLDEALVRAAQAAGLPIFPGVVTPSEICAGLRLGIRTFKFFPAESYGGLATIKALAAPFGDIDFLPTGGINEKNAAAYWAFPKVAAVGGSWIATEALIDSGKFDEITRLTSEAMALMRRARREV